MKYLITGPTGFIASRFVLLLQKCGVDRKNIILVTNKDVPGYSTLPHDNYNFSVNEVAELMVYHFAAYIPKSNDRINSTESINNIISTRNLLQSLDHLSYKLIFISTVDVYSCENKYISEDSETDPISLYGLSKLFCESWLESLSKEKAFPLQILRVGHVYGPGEDKYQKLIPSVIDSVKNNINPSIVNMGLDLRTYLFIDDCCRYIHQVSTHPDFPLLVNIVGHNPCAIADIVNYIINISGKQLHAENGTTALGSRNLVFDTSRLDYYVDGIEKDIKEGLYEEYNS